MAAETVTVSGDTRIRVRVTCDMQGHSRPCSNDVVEAQYLDAHLSVVSYIHGKISGMDSGVKVKYRATIVE